MSRFGDDDPKYHSGYFGPKRSKIRRLAQFGIVTVILVIAAIGLWIYLDPINSNGTK